MLQRILNDNLHYIFKEKIGYEKINEIRFRENAPIVAVVDGQAYFVSENGLTLTKKFAITSSKNVLEDIIYKASEFSIYAVNEEIKQGFLVIGNGVRIGVGGVFVMDEGNIKTIRDFSSLNIRIPHKVKGCCLPVFDKLTYNKTIHSTLIVSPPGQGKTTFLRDFAYQLCEKNYFLNLLILDERGEIAGKNNNLEVGDFCDILSFCNKRTGFLHGIRSMNPHAIFTDEIGDKEDFEAIKFASNSGVKIVATIHAENLEQIKRKQNFDIISKVFDRYVFLEPNGKAGRIAGVYNQNFAKV